MFTINNCERLLYNCLIRTQLACDPTLSQAHIVEFPFMGSIIYGTHKRELHNVGLANLGVKYQDYLQSTFTYIYSINS